jgi:hypothetical protein
MVWRVSHWLGPILGKCVHKCEFVCIFLQVTTRRSWVFSARQLSVSTARVTCFICCLLGVYSKIQIDVYIHHFASYIWKKKKKLSEVAKYTTLVFHIPLRPMRPIQLEGVIGVKK